MAKFQTESKPLALCCGSASLPARTNINAGLAELGLMRQTAIGAKLESGETGTELPNGNLVFPMGTASSNLAPSAIDDAG